MEHLLIAYTNQEGLFAIADGQECLATFYRKTDGFTMLMELVYIERITIAEATILANHIYEIEEIPSSGEMIITKVPSEDGLCETTETMSFDLKYLDMITLFNELCKTYGHLTEFPTVYQCENCLLKPHAQIVVCKPHLSRHGEDDLALKFKCSPEFWYKDKGIELVKDLHKRGDLNDADRDMLIKKVNELSIPGTEIEQLN